MTATASRDLREGGEWSLSQRAKNDLIFAIASVALFFVKRASRDRLAQFGRALGAVVHAFARGLRSRARNNLSIAFPHASTREHAAIARACFSNLGAHVAGALVSFREPAPLLAFDDVSQKILRDALDENLGVVLPSAHLGPWEALAATLVAGGFPLTAIVRESYDPRFDRIIDEARARAGVLTIARGGAGAATRIVRTLRSGGVLGIPMDLRTRAESANVPLLGGAAPTPIGPARLALRTGAPVVVCTVEPREAGLTVTCTRIQTADLARNDEIELTTRINAELDRRIRAAPAHWPWMHTRFAQDSIRSSPLR